MCCKIIKNYGDKQYSDVEVEDLGILIYKKTIGTTEVGTEGIICFLNGDLNQGVVITSQSHDIHNFDIDPSDFDIDFDLRFGVSGRDDSITVDTFFKLK